MHTPPASRNLASLSALLCLSMASSALAGNLLVNPDFDTDIEGWSTGLFGVTHIADDGWPAPGALRLENDVCCTRAASQCVAVHGGESYEFGVALRQGPLAPGQAGDGIGMEVFWFDNDDCSNLALPGGESLAPDVGSSWDFYLREDVIAPESARRAFVRIRQYNFAGLAGFVSFADSAFFQPTPFGIFENGFEPQPE